VPSTVDELFAHAKHSELHFTGPRPLVPARAVAIVTCMDSRIDTFKIFGLNSGEAHILRNAGGLVTDDVLRSLVLSQRMVNTREILLMHHTGCALCGADEPAFVTQLETETGMSPPYRFGAFRDVDEAVRTAIVRVREHPFLPYRDNVRGFVYEVETGRVREVTVEAPLPSER
jgi:carbonic anhydrase